MTDKPSIDTLRGLACLLLVGYHVVGADPSSGLHVADGALRTANDALAVLRMPLFTLLSGVVYGLRPMRGELGGFLRGKTRRLLLPMLVVGTLFAAVHALTPGVNQAGVDWRTIHLLPVAHFWFLEALFWIFVAVALLERWQALTSPQAFTTVMALAIALHLGLRAPHWLALDGALYLLPYFLAGLAVTRFGLWAWLSRTGTRVVMAGAAAAALLAIGAPTAHSDRQTVAMLGAGLALCGLALGSGARSAALAWLGRSSYAIYLFHVFFAAAARIALQRAGLDALPMHLAAGLVAGLAGPMLLERWAAARPWPGRLLLGRSAKLRAVPATH